MPPPENFYNLTDIDRRKCTRVVPMKIIAPGLPRTGTDSLKQALEILGYTHVYHGFEAAFQNSLDQSMWLEALDAKYRLRGTPYARADWDRLLGHCDAVTDVPSVCFAPELIAAYPEAKVVLTTRDADAWLRSIDDTLFAICRAPVRKVVCQFEWHLRYASWGTNTALTDFFGTSDWSRAAKRRIKEHEAMVKGLVPPERLLVFDVADGWEPLCRFLGQPVPDVPFPNDNAGPEFYERAAKLMQARDRVAYVNMALTALAAGACAFAALRAWSR